MTSFLKIINCILAQEHNHWVSLHYVLFIRASTVQWRDLDESWCGGESFGA